MRPAAVSTSILLGPAALAAAQSAPPFTTAVEIAAPLATATPQGWNHTAIGAPVSTGFEKRAVKTCTVTIRTQPGYSTTTIANRPTPITSTATYPVTTTITPPKVGCKRWATKHVNLMPGPTSTSGPTPTGGLGRIRRGQLKPPFVLPF